MPEFSHTVEVPKLSLCICTMNRPVELRAALESVFSGSHLPYEIIVSDDGDGLAEQVTRDFPTVKYQSGPKRGLGANRNACIRSSTGTAIAFIDDDVTVSDDFIERASQYVDGRQLVTGWELNHSGLVPKKVTPHNANFLGFQVRDPKGSYRSVVINSTIFPRALFEKARFSEKVKYGYEEIDIARQAVSLGLTIKYDDKLWVNHFPSPINRSAYTAVLNISRLYLTAKAYRDYERRPAKSVIYLVAASLHHIGHSIRRRHGFKQGFATVYSAWHLFLDREG